MAFFDFTVYLKSGSVGRALGLPRIVPMIDPSRDAPDGGCADGWAGEHNQEQSEADVDVQEQRQGDDAERKINSQDRVGNDIPGASQNCG
jgi:hypothetical protein